MAGCTRWVTIWISPSWFVAYKSPGLRAVTGSWSHCFCISLTGCWKWRRLLWAACRDLQRSHSQTQWLPREEGPRHYVLCGSILLRAEQELERGNHKVIARLIHFFSGNDVDSVQSYQKVRCFTWQESLRFWILSLEFRILGTGFLIGETWILDSNR